MLRGEPDGRRVPSSHAGRALRLPLRTPACGGDDSAGLRYRPWPTERGARLETVARTSENEGEEGGIPEAVNAAFWAKAHNVAAYSRRNLRSAEVAIMLSHHEAFSGRVLEVGCGAGRVTGYIQMAAAEAYGVDISAEMVEHCRRVYPGATFIQADMLDVGELDEAPFDVVFATFNVIDALSPERRHLALEGFKQALKPGGLLAMSSHNRAFAPDVVGPVGEALTHLRSGDLRAVARTVPRLPRQVRNHRRMRRFEQEEHEYALLNDPAHDFLLLHYYATREDQERQLADHGFEVLECLDLEGNLLADGEPAAHCSELHYVSRRSA